MKGVIFLILVVMGFASATTRPDLNAFLNKRAPNISALINQTRTDRAVMDRYCRHYQMSPSQVIAHLKTLTPGVIKKKDLYTIYSVPQGGYLKAHAEILKVGTKVYLGADGKPELVALCGNPLRGPKPEVDLTLDVVANEQEKLRDLEADPVFVSEFLAPAAEPPLVEITVETPTEEIVTGGDSAIPLIVPSATALLFPVGLFVVTTGGDTPGVPGPAAAIPFALGMIAVARARRKARRS
jgi:hypothetical protein